MMKRDVYEEEFVVEKVVDKKMTEQGLMYLIKWQGYPEETNTWEPASHLNCPALLQEFEEGRDLNCGLFLCKSCSDDKKSKPSGKVPNLTSMKNKVLRHGIPGESEQTGFARGLEAEDIVGAVFLQGKLFLCVKWAGCNDADLMAYSEIAERFPGMLAKFIDKKICYKKFCS